MNKNIWLAVLAFLLILLGFFLYTNPTPYSEISFLKKDVARKLPPPAPIVKDIPIADVIKGDFSKSLKKVMRDLKKKVIKRKLECEKNGKELKFSREQMPQGLNEVFELTLSRRESDILFLKMQDLLNSKQEININAYYAFLININICRSKESIYYLDKAILSLENSSKDFKEMMGPVLIRNIKDNLLGNRYDPRNLALVFGKLTRLIDYKIIKEPYIKELINLRDHFLKYNEEANNNLAVARGNEEVRELTIELYSECQEITVELNGILENI